VEKVLFVILNKAGSRYPDKFYPEYRRSRYPENQRHSGICLDIETLFLTIKRLYKDEPYSYKRQHIYIGSRYPDKQGQDFPDVNSDRFSGYRDPWDLA